MFSVESPVPHTVSGFRPYCPTLALVVTSHVSANHWIHCFFDSPCTRPLPVFQVLCGKVMGSDLYQEAPAFKARSWVAGMFKRYTTQLGSLQMGDLEQTRTSL